MWPFRRKKDSTQIDPPQQFSYSQVDYTEAFGDNLSLSTDDWIATRPLNFDSEAPESMGLPPISASDGDIYRTAEKLSRVRESLPIPDDGVYCPVCHIANRSLQRLRTPCPKCGRELLKFGWD